MNDQVFKKMLLSSLDKLDQASTLQVGLQEVTHLLQNTPLSPEKVGVVLSLLQDPKVAHLKPASQKEHIKLYSRVASILGLHLLPFLPRLTQALLHRIASSQDKSLVETAAHALGSVAEHLFSLLNDSLRAEEAAFSLLKSLLDPLFTSPRPLTQIGVGMALTKVLQALPVPTLAVYQDFLLDRLHQLLRAKGCHAAQQLLEALMSIILALENPLTTSLPKFLPILNESLAPQHHGGLRKVAMDIIYSLYVIQGDLMQNHSSEIYQRLLASRQDRTPAVKQAAQMCIGIVSQYLPVPVPDSPPAQSQQVNPMFRQNMPASSQRRPPSARPPSDKPRPTRENRKEQSRQTSETKIKSKSKLKHEKMLQNIQMDQPPRNNKSKIFSMPRNQSFFKNAVQNDQGYQIITSPPKNNVVTFNDSDGFDITMNGHAPEDKQMPLEEMETKYEHQDSQHSQHGESHHIRHEYGTNYSKQEYDPIESRPEQDTQENEQQMDQNEPTLETQPLAEVDYQPVQVTRDPLQYDYGRDNRQCRCDELQYKVESLQKQMDTQHKTHCQQLQGLEQAFREQQTQVKELFDMLQPIYQKQLYEQQQQQEREKERVRERLREQEREQLEREQQHRREQDEKEIYFQEQLDRLKQQKAFLEHQSQKEKEWAREHSIREYQDYQEYKEEQLRQQEQGDREGKRSSEKGVMGRVHHYLAQEKPDKAFGLMVSLEDDQLLDECLEGKLIEVGRLDLNNVEYLLNKLKGRIGKGRGEERHVYENIREAVGVMIGRGTMYLPLRNCLLSRLEQHRAWPGEKRAVDETMALLTAYQG